MDIRNLLSGPLEAAMRRKNLIIFFAATHIVFLVFGQWMVAREVPGVMYLRAEQIKEIQNLPYLKPLTGILAENLPLKILYTFFFNLVFGAFFSTTLMGVMFFFPYLIAVWRSFIIGILIYGIEATPAVIAVFYGTFLLEFGAYSLSSAIGTDMGLALLFPARKRTDSRWEALKTAAREGRDIYILVIILLFISAVWEISWLEFMGPLVKLGGIE
ncbi:MAG: stage II sporulation protein M [Deltaproteobacteria bacterium]|nr:stage II sporulation protein M [Deltaproteobacteria bacterium]